MIKLAVMSDLHIGLGARSKDLCPTPPITSKSIRKKYELKIDDTYREAFVHFIEKETLRSDFLVLPGDITDCADPNEVQLASDFIIQVANALKVDHENIIFSPGNHDVDWSAYDPTDATGIRWEQRYRSFGHDKFVFRNLIDRGYGDILKTPNFIAWEYPDLLAISYNSSSHDTPSPEKNIHHGLVVPEDIEAIRSFIKAKESPDDRVKLFILHHHPINFKNPIPRTPDFSLLTNAESLLTLIHECEFDILIHGHMHHPRFETHGTETYPHIPILCSGSFSAEIDTRWAGTIGNQFHICTIEGRVGKEKLIKGKIESWTNNHSRGWIPSEESVSGIHHIIPFGNYIMPHELDGRLEPFIANWLTKHEHILWKDIVENFPDLEHLPLNSAIEAFTRISERLGRETMYETLKDMIMY